jgi:hypothetical protein
MSNVFLLILFIVISFFIYLFFLWKFLREDYDPHRVFSFGIATFIATLIGTGVGIWMGNVWFWTGLMGYVVMTIILARKFEFRIVEIIEASTPGYFVIYLAILFYGLSNSGGLATIILLAVTFLLLILFFVLKRNYKRFTWYKSGRLGFASLISIGLLFLVRAITSVVAPDVVSHIGVVGFIPSAILSFFSFFTVYNLSNG